MDNNPEKRNDWLAQRVPGAVPEAPEYPEIDRANRCMSYYMAGYDELEIATLLELNEIDVVRDLAYLTTKMSSRQQVAMRNDRHRIKIQKDQEKNYSAILNKSLTKDPDDWFKAGLSPVPIMKEYRQAVGLEEKPGGVSISVTKQSATFVGNAPGQIPTANFGGGGKVKSFEDLVRMIIAADPSCGLQPVIDIDAQDDLPVLPPEDPDQDMPGSPDESLQEPDDDNDLRD